MKIVSESPDRLYKVEYLSSNSYQHRKGKCNDLIWWYYFSTEDGDQYAVRFINLSKIQGNKKKIWQVEFSVDGPTGDTDVVNNGRFFKVISTVIKILREFVSDNNYNIAGINIYPSSNFKDDDRRYRIYSRYIEKLLPPDWKWKKSFFDKRILLRKRSKTPKEISDK
jgi:hypothetical protein